MLVVVCCRGWWVSVLLLCLSVFNASVFADVGGPHSDEGVEGRKIYNTHCYYCHGYSGNAKTLASTYLTPPPRDFTAASSSTISFDAMLEAVRSGRPGTAMKSYATKLSNDEIIAVVDFVRESFVQRKDENLRYHTPINGWSDPQQYTAAVPYVLGKIALDESQQQLTQREKAGRKQYLSACVSCHDHGKVNNAGANWKAEAFSYPRNGHDHRVADYTMPVAVPLDAITSATPYARHDRVPVIDGLNDSGKRGERLFQENCAFCHAADGSGKNWIGSFLDPRPRDLTITGPLVNVKDSYLKRVISNGLPDTSMPAWKGVLNVGQIDDIVTYIRVAFMKQRSQ